MSDYGALAEQLNGVVTDLGTGRQQLQALAGQPNPPERTNPLVDYFSQVAAHIQQVLANNVLTEKERQRKMAQLQSDIELLRIIDSTSPDYNERLQAEREISRLSARLGVFQAQDVLRFSELLDENGAEVASVLAQAQQDLATRQTWQQIALAVESLIRVAAFGATMATKLAIAG